VNKTLFLSLLMLAAAGTLTSATSVPQWGRWEQAYTARIDAAPDTDLTVEFTSPSGKTRTIWGFWDGGSTWRVRFSPDETGAWKYRTHSRPVVPGLDGQAGRFECGKHADMKTSFLRHGAVRISANGRHFEHADGTPFFWLGDTVWYGAILSTAQDWETYLSDRGEKGFSVVHFNAVAPRNGVAADENGEISFTGVEKIRINPRFYQRFDQRVEAANAHGLLAAIVQTWGLRKEDSGNYLPESQLIRLMRYLEARYGGNHVVWILTGDARYEGEQGERFKRVGDAVFGGRPHAPTTLHPVGMHFPFEAFRKEKWLDFLIYQSGHGDDAKTLQWIHSGPVSGFWQKSPERPLINLEPPYEGHLGYQSHKPHTAYVTLRAIYWSLLNAPTAGVTYGAHGVWSWHTKPGEPPTDHPTTGAAKTWREALPLPGSTQMKYLGEMFRSIAWWELVPDERLLTAQPGGADPAQHVSASRSDKGDLALLYLPVGGKVTLRPGVLAAGLRAEWFDPRTGQRSVVKDAAGNPFTAPDTKDWVLLLHR
jgi:hypothetical protein